MSTIVTRAGKGSALTYNEVDSNFTNLNNDKYQDGGNLGTPASGVLTNCTFPTLNQDTTGTASNVTGTVAVANGGTGATTASDARTNLGVTATGSDTTYAFRSNNLSDLASASTARTNLGLGSAATTSSSDYATAAQGTKADSALQSSAIGTSILAYDSNLQSFVNTFTLPTSDSTNGYVLATNGSGTLSFIAQSGGVGTVTSVSGTGTVNGITLTGTVTTSGSLTLGGTLSGIGNSQLTNSSVTFNGQTVALGASGTITANTTNALTIGTGLSGTSFNGSSAVTIAIDSTVATLSGTQTLTNKRVTSRVSTTTSSATPTINTDNVDMYGLTAQAVDITSFTTNLSGTPTDGQKLWIYIVGTAARAITWGASFESSTATLPTTTVTTNRLDVGFVWNAATSKWRCVAVA